VGARLRSRNVAISARRRCVAGPRSLLVVEIVVRGLPDCVPDLGQHEHGNGAHALLLVGIERAVERLPGVGELLQARGTLRQNAGAPVEELDRIVLSPFTSTVLMCKSEARGDIRPGCEP
jgi:hypothetical protein